MQLSHNLHEKLRVSGTCSAYDEGVETDRTATAAPASDTPFSGMSATPPHTKTESTLAPTAEFTRIFLLAWIIRYVFRGASGTLFEKATEKPGLRNKITDLLSWPGRAFTNSFFPATKLSEMEAATYATTIGLGSGYLSYRYSKMVKSDIQNIFSEAVAYEKDKQPGEISFDDIKGSDNAIVQRTVQNYREKFFGRIGTDTLFFVAAALRHAHLTDLFLGFKGVQIFADTWKRKTTMFEDIISFVNHKINPRNGLGQPIGMGEVFDLYQHYTELFQPDRMFTTVVAQGKGEGIRWAASQPIFQRITELMNLTYAYKHTTVIDPATGHSIPQADFALPKFIYLLGHDMIDISKPKETMARIEIANRFGIPAVKEMQAMLQSGASLAQVNERFPVPAHTAPEHTHKPDEKNSVIPKGSTMQLDRVEGAMPVSKIGAESIRSLGTLTNAELQTAVG